MTRNDDFRIRPGRIKHGNHGTKHPKSFVGQMMRAAKKEGHVGNGFTSSPGRSRSRFGCGRRAAVSVRLRSSARRVVMKAAHRASSWDTLPFSAAAQAYRLSEVRGRYA
jgi:hypothetical protein